MKAHKAILCAHSETFRRAFSQKGPNFIHTQNIFNESRIFFYLNNIIYLEMNEIDP